MLLENTTVNSIPPDTACNHTTPLYITVFAYIGMIGVATVPVLIIVVIICRQRMICRHSAELDKKKRDKVCKIDAFNSQITQDAILTISHLF